MPKIWLGCCTWAVAGSLSRVGKRRFRDDGIHPQSGSRRNAFGAKDDRSKIIRPQMNTDKYGSEGRRGEEVLTWLDRDIFCLSVLIRPDRCSSVAELLSLPNNLA